MLIKFEIFCRDVSSKSITKSPYKTPPHLKRVATIRCGDGVVVLREAHGDASVKTPIFHFVAKVKISWSWSNTVNSNTNTYTAITMVSIIMLYFTHIYKPELPTLNCRYIYVAQKMTVNNLLWHCSSMIWKLYFNTNHTSVISVPR